MKKLITMIVLVLAVSGISYAGLVSVDDPFEGNSWSQRWRENGVGNFDCIAAKMVTAGDTFESVIPPSSTTALNTFSVSGWGVVYEDAASYPTISVAAGPAVSDIQFNTKFPDPKSNTFTFSFLAYNGDTLVDSIDITWTGSGWSYGTPGQATWQPERCDVPEPATIVILALGGLGLFRKRLV